MKNLEYGMKRVNKWIMKRASISIVFRHCFDMVSRIRASINIYTSESLDLFEDEKFGFPKVRA